MKNREASIDTVCGLLIIWMVVMHIYQWTNLSGVSLFSYLSKVFFFFMGWFFYKGGSFAKLNNLKNVVWGGGNRLIIPFIVFSIIGTIFQWIDFYICGEFNWRTYFLSPIRVLLFEGSVPGNLPLWFLLSLFIVRVLFQLLLRIKYADSLLLIGLLVFYFVKYVDIFGIGCYIKYPFYLYNSLIGLSFYWMGFRLRNHQYKSLIFFIALAVLCIITIFAPAKYNFREITDNSPIRGDFMLFVISAIAACVVVNNLFHYLCKRINFNILSFIGVNSMFVFCTHWIALTITHFSIIVPFHIDNGWLQMLIYILGVLLLLPCFFKLIEIIKNKAKFIVV